MSYRAVNSNTNTTGVQQMTRQQYEAYQEAVEAFFQREGLDNLSIAGEEDDNSRDPHFSWHPCDCCGRDQGGDRYDCSGWNSTTGEIQDGYSCCTDCVYMAEYGRLDDDTMWAIEHSD